MQRPDEYIRNELSGFYTSDEVRNFTRLVLQDVCGLSVADIAACKFNNLSDSEVRKIEEIASRLRNYEPYQYILGRTEFYGMPFVVTPDVLIPRPETEELVEWMLSEICLRNPKILDIGTGSGCIAVALAKRIPAAEVHAWDISEKALNVARRNAELNGVNVQFSQKNVLLPVNEEASFDVIVSNPPYVTENEKDEIAPNVLDFEPHEALFVPESNPLLFYDRIADLALQRLTEHGRLFLEINSAKGNETVAMLKKKGFTEVELRKDLSANDRMIKAQKP